jgi:hypothetical protein
LKKFEELFLENILLKMQNQTLGNRNPKWNKWWHIIQKFIEEYIPENMELACSYEQNYQLELHVY